MDNEHTMTTADVDEAIGAPERTFDAPSDVVYSDTLALTDKLTILKRWRQAELDLERAASEGMEGPKSRIDEINKALLELDPTQDQAEQLHK